VGPGAFRPPRALLAPLLLSLAMGVAAQPQGPRFEVRGFRVTGPNPLAAAETDRILQAFVGPGASIDTLQRATAALEAAFRAHGFRLHFVQLPAQELGESVQLEVASATLDSVTVEGLALRSESGIRRALPALREGETPDLGALAVQTAMANTNPARQVLVNLREGREPGRIDASIAVTEKRPWTVGAELSNAGTPETGRDRVTLTASHNNLFDRDHQLVTAYTTSLARSDDVRQVGIAYSVPLPAQGAVAAASYTRSDVVGQFGAFSSTGAGHALQFSYTLHRPPQGELQGRWIAAAEERLYRGTEVDGVKVGSDRRSMTLSLGYALRYLSPERAWNAQAELAHNTGWGSGNDLAAYQAEYPGIETLQWTALRAGFGWLERLPRDWSFSVRGALQYTSQALIAGEQFGLGGQGSVRGTATERPIAGDRGVSAALELLTPVSTQGLQGVAFVDAGWIGNVDADNVQRVASDRLVGAGLGLRYASGALQAGAEYGRLLVGSRMPLALNPSAPQRGDDRLYLNVGVRF
jgi:hemolysin activation/secretion protein